MIHNLLWYSKIPKIGTHP